MTQSCPNISLTQFKKPIRDCYLMMHDVGGIENPPFIRFSTFLIVNRDYLSYRKCTNYLNKQAHLDYNLK
ncbi:hypothetical protein BpHYR1_038964 [Brachionus plicatilis]|uniref:Uncharacterized protein n=1 Tax=Brachionus plicatilis TaxID=10195 RepID=A0A3M7PPP2_BRAPC|nr:hypothetical protein BpHYR1_038964 [Brachionus plicatilis]